LIKLLIVDDEKHIREGIKNGIDWEKHGISICGCVGSAMEALSLIEQHMPAIVITDIRMPDMDGLELLEVINKKYSNIKVILISGYKEFSYAQTAISLNAFCYILKPIDSEQLLEKVLEAKREIENRLKVVKENEDIRKKLEENITIIRDNFFTRLVRGKMTNIQEIKKTADFLGLNLDGGCYCVAIAQLDIPQKDTANSWYDEGWYKAAVMNKAEEMLNKLLHSYSFYHNENIGFLMSGSELKSKLMRQYFEVLREWINNELGLSVTIGIGNAYGDLIKIPISFREAQEALEYRVVAGKNAVIHVESVYSDKQDNIAISDFSDTLENSGDDLSYALKLGDRNAICEIVENIISVFQRVIKADIREKDHLIFLLTFFLTKITYSMKVNFKHFFSRENDLYTTLCNCHTMNDIRNFLLNYFDEIILELQNKVKSRNSFLVKQAIEYINANVYSDISLVKVADHLSIHPNYLSKIFKQEVGESFIEYIIRVKMREAKNLICNSNDKIYEIADKLHYKDVGHFTRLFKKTYGVSPTEYRQLM